MKAKYDNKWRTAVILSTLRQLMKDAHKEVTIEEVFPFACKVVDDMRESYIKSDQKRALRKCGNCDSFCECGLTGKKMDDKACEMFDDSYYQFKKNKEEAK